MRSAAPSARLTTPSTAPPGASDGGPAPRIFLSYARADDARTAAAAALHAHLTTAGFDVWWDRVRMPSRGLTFLQEIRDAIDACDRLVVLMGPDAARSDYVRAEWQYALAVGKVVNPILVDGTFDLLPAELRNLDCPSASSQARRDRAIQQLVRQLRDPAPPLGPLLGLVPEVPAHYQPRGAEATALADCALIDTRQPVVTRPEQRITIVHGMPGAGKSALAAAFVRSPEVRRAFADGVVWVRAGKDAAPLRAALGVCTALGSAGPPRADSVQVGVALRQALAERACLVAVDDVWSPDVVEPFLHALGPRSRLVVTTRQAELRASLGSLGVEVGVLPVDAALRQLADWTGLSMEALPPEAAAVARECGYLPFALALCGAMVRGGLRFADLLANLRSAKLGFLDRRLGDYPYRNFLSAMAASVEALRRERRALANRYLELVVFEPGSRVPIEAVARLWAATGPARAAYVREALSRLQGKSLLRVGDDAIELHDLQWDYLAASSPNPRALHRRLLARYARELPLGLHTAPPGDYIVQHAARHLDAAGDLAGLIHRIDRAWFERKFAGEALRESFLRDVDRAMGRVATPAPRHVAPLARLALVRSSVAALAVNVPPDALYVLARCGETAIALDATRLAGDGWSQAHYYSLVASGLQDRGDVQEARRLVPVVLDLVDVVPHQRTSLLAWAAQLLAETGDPLADAIIDRAFAACEADAAKLPVEAAMVRVARAAIARGRRADARRMLAAAERKAVTGLRGDAPANALAAVADGWMQAGDMPRALRLVDGRIGRWRRDGAARSWSPPVGLLGAFALACADAGLGRDAVRVWSRCRARDRRDRDYSWYAALIAARLGRVAEAGRWARSTGKGLELSERKLTIASTLAACGSELAHAGRPRDAIRAADRSLALLASSANYASTPSPRHADIAERRHRARTAETRCAIAATLVEGGDPDRAARLAREALLASAQFAWDLRHVGEAEGALAAAHARSGRVGLAMSMARAVADDYARDEALAALVTVFATSGRMDAMLGAARAIDSASYSDWHRSRVLADEAIPALPARLLKRAAPRALRVTTDVGARCRALARLALRLPNIYLAEAARAWVESDTGDDEGTAMLAIARAAQGRRDEAEIRRRIEPRAFDVPGPKAYWRIKWIDHLARVVVVWGDRGATGRALAAAECDDIEYEAAAASRVALAFVEAGWLPEARRAADLAATRLQTLGEGHPLGEGDVNARLGLVMHRLGRSQQALAYLRRALAVLSGTSSSQSAFDDPKVMRHALGVSLAEVQSPGDALQTIRDVAGSEPDDAADTLMGLFDAVLARRGARAAGRLESAIEAAGRGCGPWLRVRLGARWQAVGNRRLALARLAMSLEQSSHQGPATTLDVIATGAAILGAVDSGTTLRRVYGALRELQSWGGAA